MQKCCSRCRKTKSVAEFSLDRRYGTPYGQCRQCRKEIVQDWRSRNRERNREVAKLARYKNPLAVFVRNARSRAKLKGRKFQLTKQYVRRLWQQQKGRCALSDLAFDLDPTHTRGPFRPALDRKDNRRGYVPGNVRFILQALNIGLNEYGLETYLCIAEAVLKKRGQT